MVRVVYSSGPIENDKGFDTTLSCGLIPAKLTPISKLFFIYMLNNNKNESVDVKVRYFSLIGCNDRRKRSRGVTADIFVLPKRSVEIGGTPVNRFFRFEIQIILEAKSLKAINNVLFSAWGKDRKGNIVPFHRFLQKDFKRFIIKRD